jgi:hypothetical protein
LSKRRLALSLSVPSATIALLMLLLRNTEHKLLVMSIVTSLSLLSSTLEKVEHSTAVMVIWNKSLARELSVMLSALTDSREVQLLLPSAPTSTTALPTMKLASSLLSKIPRLTKSRSIT